MHTPQKQPLKSTSQHQQILKKHPQQQLIQDLTNLKLNLHQTNTNINVNHIALAESDESKLARQKLHFKQTSKDLDNDSGGDSSTKKTTDPKFQTLPYNSKYALSKSASSGAISYNSSSSASSMHNKSNESDSEKAGADSDSSSNKGNSQNTHQKLTVHSTPLSTINKSVAVPMPINGLASSTVITTSSASNHQSFINHSHHLQKDDKPAIRPKAKHQIPSGNLVVPPRKPISSVAPTTMTMAPKIVAHSPKVHMVAPNVNTTPIVSASEYDKHKPALPPKPSKNSPSESDNQVVSSVPTVVSVINKPPMSEPLPMLQQQQQHENQSPTAFPPNADNLPIKARPLTIKKQPLTEQPPRLRTMNAGIKPVQYTSRRIEMPPAFLFPEIEKGNLKDKSDSQQSPSGSIDDTDRSAVPTDDDIQQQQQSASTGHHDVVRRTRSSINENGKAKLARRVSFDPLALLLDASLEGELELVKKTTMQVSSVFFSYYI